MRVRIVGGAGAPWEGEALVTEGAIWLAGKPHCPLDDLAGIIILAATDRERDLLRDAGFELPWAS